MANLRCIGSGRSWTASSLTAPRALILLISCVCPGPPDGTENRDELTTLGVLAPEALVRPRAGGPARDDVLLVEHIAVEHAVPGHLGRVLRQELVDHLEGGGGDGAVQVGVALEAGAPLVE